MGVPVIELCGKLATITSQGLTKTFLCAGGGEDNEAALKFAVRLTGRTEVISLTGAYVDSPSPPSVSVVRLTFGDLSLALFAGLISARFPSADPCRPLLGMGGTLCRTRPLGSGFAADSGHVAALILELIQGPDRPVSIPRMLRSSAAGLPRSGNPADCDEVQTGVGRCGKTWACDVYNVCPDILVIGKALGGGVPIGAFVARKDLVPKELESGFLGVSFTFMNQPLAAAAGLAVLGILEREKLADRARDLGAQATERFTELAKRCEVIGNVARPRPVCGSQLRHKPRNQKPCHGSLRQSLEVRPGQWFTHAVRRPGNQRAQI